MGQCCGRLHTGVLLGIGMRWIAQTTSHAGGVRRVVLYEAGSGAHLFLSRTIDDRGSFADEWYATTEEARESARARYGIIEEHWCLVPDPEPGCQHDWIRPVRIARDSQGRALRGRLEIRIDGAWMSLQGGER